MENHSMKFGPNPKTLTFFASSESATSHFAFFRLWKNFWENGKSSDSLQIWKLSSIFWDQNQVSRLKTQWVISTWRKSPSSPSSSPSPKCQYLSAPPWVALIIVYPLLSQAITRSSSPRCSLWTYTPPPWSSTPASFWRMEAPEPQGRLVLQCSSYRHHQTRTSRWVAQIQRSSARCDCYKKILISWFFLQINCYLHLVESFC